MEDPSRLPADAELAERLRAGDEDAFRMVLEAWSPSMLRLARSFVSTGDSAEEVVQEAWLGVIQGIERFEGRSALKTWVFRILVNIAKGRGVKESRTLPFSSLLPEDEGPSVDPSRFRSADDPYAGRWSPGQKPQTWALPESEALDGEVRRVVADALDELPERHRTVVILRDVEGYASDEVCRLLNISPGNQRVILHRARAVVRGRLETYFASAERTESADHSPRRNPRKAVRSLARASADSESAGNSPSVSMVRRNCSR
ncbi:RNA polymerase, sigma-24 subunit, ECF subfamily [Catenulispora acidiphila DSM 44928]|uniref:RNA polymerase, sigma-24 subunit, ECF subfamily n=1 Tax=Catenulispora acidiphila (strain DSM 44928 / JCM 14897 / NBRC 102108 / NRRL B-24433 / ID139908) TaxID=479433 RepID=C7Q7J1_CATAD|nr:sigma-70 family RNA polymerase sigma factor [Catenulispora acidiphila]ACU72184.1 RNA polymerase, sigma-24 subunit, ECF subfamily [Catenulispora acidiphila DSM 44928]